MSLDERVTLAAQAATRMGFYLHGAALTADRDEKRRLLTRAFTCWAGLTRQVGETEQLAPNCAREGYAEAAKIADFVEGRAA